MPSFKKRGIREMILECSFEIMGGEGGKMLGSSMSMLMSFSSTLGFTLLMRFIALARQKPRPKPISRIESSFRALAFCSISLGIMNLLSHSLIMPAVRLWYGSP
ncbi:MAG: hypothetical protein NZL90_00215 [Aquificaceae bacterium]|nr:hypothetical protein [Aquificaceae bacterium]MDW8236823.1 hypothetical protein [Aquificaceae bacterium]